MESLKKERLSVETSYHGVSENPDVSNEVTKNRESDYITKNYLDAKMRLLSERISSAVLVDATKANPDVVSFGMYVRYNDKTIRIVGVDEADASKGLISFLSPIAKSFIGKKKGDKFEIKVPKGVETIEIQEVSTFLGIEQRAMSREQNTVTELVEVTEKLAHNSQPIAQGKSSTANVQSSKLPEPVEGTVTESVEVTEKTAHSTQPIAQGKENFSDSQVFKPSDSITDFLPLVNEQGNIVGRALYCEIHNGNKVLHPAVHLIVSNSNKEIVGKYCWHVAFGETAEKTLKRKIKEIMPIETHNRVSQTTPSIKPKIKKQYIRETKTEKELVSVFTAICDGEILPSPDDKEWEMIFELS
jgi:transcription elongation factor GreB